MSTETPQLFRGATLRGSARLEGGSVEQQVKMLTVDLLEFWVTGSGKNRSYHQRNRGRVTVVEDATVDPTFAEDFSFELQIPDDARCTRRREGWKLAAEAHINLAVDARADAELKVLPHAEALAIQRCLRDSLGFMPISWDGSRADVYYDFRAPEWLATQLDGVGIRIIVAGDTAQGALILNRQERGLGGFLGAVVGADRESLEFSIPRAALVTKRGTPAPAGAAPYLRSLLMQAGIEVRETAPPVQ